MVEEKKLTANNGSPVGDNQNVLTAGAWAHAPAGRVVFGKICSF
jgi:catalase